MSQLIAHSEGADANCTTVQDKLHPVGTGRNQSSVALQEGEIRSQF